MLSPDFPIAPEIQARASIVFNIIEALERGERPTGWIEQLVSTMVGTLHQTDDIERQLGTIGCLIWWTDTRVKLIPTFHRFKHSMPVREVLEYRISRPSRPGGDYDRNVTDCLECIAKLSFVHGYNKAARAALKEYVVWWKSSQI